MTEPTWLTCPRCQARFGLADTGERVTKVSCPRCQAVLTAGPPAKERPRRKKLPRPAAHADTPPGTRAAALVLVLLAGALAIGWGVFALVQRDRPTVPVPVGFIDFQTPDGSLRCEFPSDWKHDLAGSAGHYEVTFQLGAASARIVQVPVENIPADLAAATDGTLNDPERSPLSRAHERQRPAAAEPLSGYQEEDAENVTTGLRYGRRSAFTATASRGKKMCGYRATLWAAGREYDVLCQCPAADWENLEPAFAHIIETIGTGGDH
jgi:hypothetical protein